MCFKFTLEQTLWGDIYIETKNNSYIRLIKSSYAIALGIFIHV